jgi:hypothetical protein
LRTPVAAVEGTLIRTMPSAFAGSRWNAALGRSVFLCRGLVPRQANAPATAGVLWKNEEGNVVSVRQAHALVAVTPNKRRPARGHVLRSVQRPVHVNRHLTLVAAAKAEARGGGARDLVSRSGKPTQVGANRHRDLDLRTVRGSPRITALLVRGQP